jgi:hypothetical protein
MKAGECQAATHPSWWHEGLISLTSLTTLGRRRFAKKPPTREGSTMPMRNGVVLALRLRARRSVTGDEPET